MLLLTGALLVNEPTGNIAKIIVVRFPRLSARKDTTINNFADRRGQGCGERLGES